MADIPIPLIEDGPSAQPDGETNGRTSRHPTPILRSAAAQWANINGGSARKNLDGVTQQSSPDLNNVAAVSGVFDVAGQERVQGTSPDWGYPTLRSASTPRRRRRRSSSRTRYCYDVAGEAPPQDDFNTPSFQAAFRDIKTVVSNVAEVLGSGLLHNDADSTILSHLHENARALAGFQCPSTRTVGFVGDSGAGKSSLINSLLDISGQSMSVVNIAIESELGDFPDAAEPLTQAIESQLRIAANAVDEAFGCFEEQVGCLCVEAFSSIRTSLIGQTMESAYRECSFEHGRDSHERRKDIIGRKLSQESIFRQLMTKCSERFHQLANGIQKTIRDNLADHMDVIHGVLEIVRSQNAAQEGEEDVHLRVRVDEAVRNARARHASILASIAA